MNIEILDWKAIPSRTRLGQITVKYHDLHMKCDLVFYNQKNPHLWIRTPEVWYTPDKKTRFCEWDSRGISDDFQKETLTQLLRKYDIDLEQGLKLFQQVKAKKKRA